MSFIKWNSTPSRRQFKLKFGSEIGAEHAEKALLYRTGHHDADERLSQDALYALLKNRICRGLIMHKGVALPGQHNAIVDADFFGAAPF